MPVRERVQLAIPSGELKAATVEFLQRIGLDFNAYGRKVLIPVTNMPIDLLILRARMIPMVVDSNAITAAGITGSDMLWESDWKTYKENGFPQIIGEKLPIAEINEKHSAKWALYVGVSSEFAKSIRQRAGKETVEVSDLYGRLTTEYPNISIDYFAQHNIGLAISVSPLQLLFQQNFVLRSQYDEVLVTGGSEGMLEAFPDCNTILSVISSGASARDNNIEILDRFHEGTLRMIDAAWKLNSHEIGILSDLRNLIEVARQKKRRD